MNDGLYLNNNWVAFVDCALTLQGNDITKPDALHASYSNSFELPDTSAVRQLTQNAEQIDSGGRDPYRILPAFLKENGEITFRGYAELISFQGGWKVNLLDSLVHFFDLIQDKKLADLDLSQFDHEWSLASITRLAGSEKGAVYPIIDYGSSDGVFLPYDTMTPAVYIHSIVEQIAKEAGYRLKGNWLTDDWYKRATLPFVEDSPTVNDEDWKKDRSSRVTTSTPDVPPIELRNGHPIDVVLPLNNDNSPLDGYDDGILDCYKANRLTYVCPVSRRYDVQASVDFRSIIMYGAPEVRLIVTRNGQKAGEVYWSEAGYREHLGQPETLMLDVSINCLAGDELQIRLQGNARTSIASYSMLFFQGPGEMWASFAPSTDIHFGVDTWPVAANLPSDISCSDLLFSVAKIMSGSYTVDETTKTIELVPLNEVIAQESQAQDLSECVVENEEPELLTKIDTYGQKNWLKWKPASEKKNAGFGDGYLVCNATNLSPEVTLVELPFAACINSATPINGYGTPVLIKTRTVRGFGENQTIDKSSAQPCIVLVEPSKVFPVKTKTLDTDGNVIEATVTMTGCWWSIRPDTIKTGSNSFSMAFSRVTGSREQTLLERYFTPLQRILRRPRQVTLSLYLNASQIASINFKKPIRIKSVRCGSLDINDSYFILIQVKQYQAGLPTSVIMIAY